MVHPYNGIISAIKKSEEHIQQRGWISTQAEWNEITLKVYIIHDCVCRIFSKNKILVAMNKSVIAMVG